MRPVLEVNDLQIYFPTRRGVARAVDGVSFDLNEGESLGIVGESGCGKSMTALGILRLVPEPGRIVGGSVRLDGDELLSKSEHDMRRVRGRLISMILQDPMTSLNPVLTIGAQIGEAVELHQRLRRGRLKQAIIEIMRLVRIPSPELRFGQFPHQFSGGMRQRVAGAIALSCTPKVIIADEPTTSLDATIQAQYLDLLKEVQERTRVGLIFVSHDISIVARMCQRVLVMYAGRIIEAGTTTDVLRNPSHPYTVALLNCVPKVEEQQRLPAIDGQPPDPLAFPEGCRFAPRCPKAAEICRTSYPQTVRVGPTHLSSCWFSKGNEPHSAD